MAYQKIDVPEKLQSQFDVFLDTIPGSVYWKDAEGIYLGCNTAVLKKGKLCSKDDIIGKTDLILWPAQAENFRKTDREVLESGKTVEAEEIITLVDGSVLHFLSIKSPLRDNEGNIVGIIGSSADITEHKKTEAALKEAKLKAERVNRARSEFIANMSHDLKTPLSGIIGAADLLLHRIDQEEDKKSAKNILLASQQLLMFFDNCLEIAKSDDAEANLSIEQFNIRLLIEEIADLFRPAVENKKLKLCLCLDEALPDYVVGSRAGLYRVLMNLVGNAIKFTHTGSITLSVTRGKKSTSQKIIARFTIADTGIGIPKDQHVHIFERFTKLLPSDTGINTGSGLGLYLVQKYVTLMKGDVYLTSEENEGSQFTVAVPLDVSLLAPVEYTRNILSKQTIALPAQPYRHSKREQSNSTIRVLFVEDTEIAQHVGMALLTSLACHVDIANTGAEAIRLFKLKTYDLVFMDLGLLDMTGYKITQQLREIEKSRTDRVPIIALTATMTEEIKKACLNSGIDNVLNKPLLREQAKILIAHYVSDTVS